MFIDVQTAKGMQEASISNIIGQQKGICEFPNVLCLADPSI